MARLGPEPWQADPHPAPRDQVRGSALPHHRHAPRFHDLGEAPHRLEFWRNVLFTNDLGNPDDPADRGSRTIDTADPALLAGIGTVDDSVDYTCETGTSQDDWYSLTTVGVFAKPEPEDDAASVAQKRGRILQNVGVFLPFNMRAVVVIETDTVVATDDQNLGLTRAVDETA